MRIHGALVHKGGQGSHEGDAGRWAILWHGAIGHVDVDVVVLKNIGLVGEEGFHKAEGELGAFLHDIAELTGEHELAAALGKEGFYKEDIAAKACPGQTCNHARALFFEHTFVEDRLHIEPWVQVARSERKRALLALGHAHSGTAAEGVEALAQAAYTSFHGVVANQSGEDLIVQNKSVFWQAVFLAGLFNQVAAGNAELFF